MLKHILDFFFPPQCFVCFDSVSDFGTFCSKCWCGIEFLHDDYCYCCGFSFSSSINFDLCSQCYVRPPDFSMARSVFRYNDVGRKIIERFKFNNCSYMAHYCAKWMFDFIPSIFEGADMIVPVPLHKSRLRERGYNQSALITKRAGDMFGIKYDLHSLRRIKKTDAQSTLSAKKRLNNVKGAFACEKDAFRGKKIVIIDDVMTTGYTVKECASQVIGLGGAKWVRVATLARSITN